MNRLTGVREGIAVFGDRASAEAWLDEPAAAETALTAVATRPA